MIGESHGISDLGVELLISVVIVARNSRGTLRRAVRSVLEQDIGINRLELLLIDSESHDGTREDMEDLANEYAGTVRVLSNPGVFLAKGWNIGIANSRGKFLLRLDAHAELDSRYVSGGLDALQRLALEQIDPERIVVGGVLVTTGEGLWGRTNAEVLSHPFGVGNSRFRTQPSFQGFTDTAVYGVYPTHLFEGFGILNEQLRRAEDLELHARLRSAGVAFYQNPSMKARYVARPTYLGLLQKSYSDGVWAMVARKFDPHATRLRHIAPLGVLSAAAVIAGVAVVADVWPVGLVLPVIYGLGVLFAALQIAIRSRSPSLLLTLPFGFVGFHLARAGGMLHGLVKGLTVTVR